MRGVPAAPLARQAVRQGSHAPLPSPPACALGDDDAAWHAGLLDVHALEDADLLGEARLFEPTSRLLSRESDSARPAALQRQGGLDPQFMMLSPDGHGGRQAFPRSSVAAARLAAVPAFSDDGLPRIRVLVRKRPLNARERSRKEDDVVAMRAGDGALTVHEPRTKVDLTRYTEVHAFAFDQVLDEGASNDDIYASAVAPLVGVMFRRGKATCFAYGQTGASHWLCPLLCAAGC